ncbi:MAG: starch-binding protein, partial [Bacteroidota bacterium]|nr:starch-binding protein [Bacteroidota bacterium]
GGPEYPPQGNPVSAISLAPNYLDLMEGSSESLILTIEPEDADVMSIVWESSDEAVATVTQQGLVTAVSEGTATVSVTVDGLTASCPVTVNRESPPEVGEGPTVYVFNATGWTYVYLYAWADGVGSIETDWPGQFPDNDIPKVDGWSYYRYTLSDAWCAGPVNLIFNDGNSTGQTEDFPITMQGGESYFFYVDNGKAQLIPDPHNFDPNDYVTPDPPTPSGDPATLYAYDGNGWGSMNIWVWTTTGVNLSTIWPGQAAEATEVIGGHTFYKFTIPGEFTSETENLNIIFCNGAGTSQTADLAFAIKPGQTYYFNVTGTGAEIIDPENFNPADPPAKDGSWGIAGTMNGWSASSPIEMTVEGSFYVAKGVTLTADTEFKFVQDKSWAVNRGGTFIALGETFELFQDGANIKPGLTGTYDIYINASGAYAYIPNPAQ